MVTYIAETLLSRSYVVSAHFKLHDTFVLCAHLDFSVLVYCVMLCLCRNIDGTEIMMCVICATWLVNLV